MKRAISRLCRFASVGVLFASWSITTSGPALAAEPMIGQDEYNRSCAVCHGPKGKGDGPFASLLDKKPANLTLLAKKNKGKYPFQKVYKAIDGRWEVNAHGPAEMPIWGDWYLADAIEKAGPAQGPAEKIVRGRILELVYFIGLIQQN